MKPVNFDYHRASSISEACDVLQQEGGNARIIAGGQSLGAMLNMRLATPSILIDINRIDELSRIEEQGRFLRTAAIVRQADALASATIAGQVPLLALALPHVGHFQTRSRGTLAGSVAHADPSAEVSLVLATLGGEVELASRKRRRKVAAREFFLSSLTTARQEDEMITGLLWPRAVAGDVFLFEEHAMRAGDFALVAVACHFARAAREIHLGFGGCGDTPQVISLPVPERPGRRWIEETVDAAAREVLCRGDLHASSEYRKALVTDMAERMASQVVAAMGGN